MQSYAHPLVDDDNPLYCPAVSVTAYMNHLRHKLDRKYLFQRQHRNNDDLLLSFASVLDKAITQQDFYKDDEKKDEDEDSRWLVHHVPLMGVSDRTSSGSRNGLPAIPGWEKDVEESYIPKYARIDIKSISQAQPNLKRKRSSFTDLHGPPRYARSFQSTHDSSFDVDIKREQLHYSDAIFRSSSCFSQDRTEDILVDNSSSALEALVGQIDSILPGVRLKERLLRIGKLTYQTITDYLAEHGIFLHS
ncbi:hypothetical protein BDQ12DRAFT_689521 [Crucibulum laeve]|uniref:Uncharacterized protein n=1 Tax=Crucibulum laeve TaxID=68775 RepID=A0A5C3LQI4_9AGAR|nr:hypothetical protein BDQ12DRAFT_689521 [Crucibulum laeve]